MTGIWSKHVGPDSPSPTISQLLKSMDEVCQLARALQNVWLEGELLIDYNQQTFWGDDLNPAVVKGLANLAI